MAENEILQESRALQSRKDRLRQKREDFARNAHLMTPEERSTRRSDINNNMLLLGLLRSSRKPRLGSLVPGGQDPG